MTREERELAITYLEEMKEKYIEGVEYERHPLPEYYAIETAIQALEQEPCDKCVYSTKDGYCQYDDITETIPPFEPCEDAISREAVLNYIHRILNQGTGKKKSFEFIQKYVANMPSVKPQEAAYCDRNICLRNEYNSIGCNECEVTKSQESNTVIGTGDGAYYRIKALQAQADGEYISKDKMLMFLNDMRYGIAPDETVADGDERREREAQVDVLDDLMEVVEQMPSVAIPNKVGHWEYNQYDGNPNIGNWHCSKCRNIVSDMPTCMGKPLYEFCPNCGCPMEIER